MKQEAAKSLSLRRRLAYALTLSITMSALLVCSMELFLRGAGFGSPSCYYRDAEGPEGYEIIRENRDFTAPYFARELIRRPPAMRLLKDKPKGEYRVFILGSSAAMGDPESSFSVARVLEKMLSEAYPEIRFTVVNAAITAINSNVVKRIADDCADLEPDLYIVYEGNNEVIGPYGPAAVFAPFMRSPRAIALTSFLRSTRCGQLISTIANTLGQEKGQVEQWGGMEMFIKQQFSADAPELDSVRNIFASNLRSIVESATDAGAHTLLCTVLTNQRDFAPFMSANRADLSPEEHERWLVELEKADNALARGDEELAASHYEKAAAIDSRHAALAFKRGRIALAQGKQEEARKLLQLALDLDTLRFRTDSRLNDCIRESARSIGPQSCTLVDIEQTLSAKSAGGVAGNEYLYEHVHLTMLGNYEAAALLFDATSNELQRRGLVAQVAQEVPSYERIRLLLGYTPFDQAMIIEDMLQRFGKPPFTGQMDNALRLETWKQRQAKAATALADENYREAILSAYELALKESTPYDWILWRNYAIALVSFGKPREAIAPLKIAMAQIDDDPDLLFALAKAYEGSKCTDQAKECYDKLRELEPRYPGLPE
ncbi:MAG: hypothetical protein JW942_01320 [Opitutales bacterium]|nr:hypothetical protein [Opitutales bacterium]